MAVTAERVVGILSISFDNRGRLWVTDTIEYPTPPKGPGRDALKVFEDSDGDGHYDTMTTLVDRLSMPTGAEPIPGGAIVFSVPSIFGCYDTTGDGRIDQRRLATLLEQALAAVIGAALGLAAH